MNWRRGLFRLWLVATCVWLVVGTYLVADEFKAVRDRVPPGVNKYECLMANACPQWPKEPDWDTRRRGLVALAAPPIVVPILCFLMFWAGWASLRTALWIGRGFRRSS